MKITVRVFFKHKKTTREAVITIVPVDIRRDISVYLSTITGEMQVTQDKIGSIKEVKSDF